MVYDKEKEDAPFVPEDGLTSESGSVNGQRPSGFVVKKSVQSRNQKTNPVAVWKVSNLQVNCIAFSPDGRHLAVVSEDGSLRIIDYLREHVLDAFTSYYGGLMTVTWSPDGRYILTGGQDDLVSIWSFADAALVARCQGHNSWVTDVKFDPWRCDDRNYRFGSVGEDCRLLLWDFSVGMLGRPKAVSELLPDGSIIFHICRLANHDIKSRHAVHLDVPDQKPHQSSDAYIPFPIRIRSCENHRLTTDIVYKIDRTQRELFCDEQIPLEFDFVERQCHEWPRRRRSAWCRSKSKHGDASSSHGE